MGAKSNYIMCTFVFKSCTINYSANQAVACNMCIGKSKKFNTFILGMFDQILKYTQFLVCRMKRW